MSKDFKNPSLSFFSDETIAGVDGQPDTGTQDQKSPRIMGQAQPDRITDGAHVKAMKTADSNGKNRRVVIEVPAGYKPTAELVETKSKRFNLLLQPSLYAEAKAVSNDLGISLNDFIHRAIQEATYNDYVRGLIESDIRGEN